MGQCHSISSLAHAHPCSLSITVTHIPPTNGLKNISYESDKVDHIDRRLQREPQSSCQLLHSGKSIRAHYAHVAISDQRVDPDVTRRTKSFSQSTILHTDISTPGSRRIASLGRCERLTIPVASLRNHCRAIDPSCSRNPCKISHPKQLQPRSYPSGDCIMVDDQIRRAIALPLPPNHLDRPFSSESKPSKEYKEYYVLNTCSQVPARSTWKFSELEVRYGRAVEYISTLAIRKRKNDSPDDGWLWIQ